MKCRIAAIPLTGNRYLHLHWAARGRERKRWESYLLQALGRYGPIAKKHKAWVLIRVWRKRLQDKDNLHTSLKPVLDALRHQRWIWQDSPKWLSSGFEEFRASKGEPERTEIEVVWTREEAIAAV